MRLEALKEQRAPTLAMIDKHRSLIKDREDLAASSQDASRLMMRGQKGEKRDPTRLLREEKMRKRIAKELPKVEADLREILQSWEEEYGRPFLVHGERYLDDIHSASARVAGARSKTPSNQAPMAQPKSVKTAPPASRNGTLRGPPPRSHTPTSSRNPLAASVRPASAARPPSAATRPVSAASTNFGASVSAHRPVTGIPRSPRAPSPSKVPALANRAPLSSMPLGNNSPERRPRPAVLGHSKDDFQKSVRGVMGPPRGFPPKMKEFNLLPPTPSPMNYSDMGERSASIVRHVEPEDVYADQESISAMSSYQTHSRAPSELGNYPTPTTRPVSRFDLPSAPPPAMARQTSNSSSVMTSNSVVSGSENWETYTDASGDFEPETDARAAYYAKMRAAKRESPDDGYDGRNAGVGKTFKGYTLSGVRAIGNPRQVIAEESSEVGWTDVGETF